MNDMDDEALVELAEKRKHDEKVAELREAERKTVLKNKWNGKLYTMIKKTADEVTLKRNCDGTVFTIGVKEYFSNYHSVKK